jgi:hypothetical protein
LVNIQHVRALPGYSDFRPIEQALVYLHM